MKLLLILISVFCFADSKKASLNRVKEAFWKYDIFPMPYVGYNINFHEQPNYFNGENKSFYLNLKKKQIIEACRFHIKRLNEMCSTNWYVSSYPKYCEEGTGVWKRNYWKGGGNWIKSPGFPLLNTCKVFLKLWGFKESKSISKTREKLLTNLQKEADKVSERISIFGKDIFYLNRDAKFYCETRINLKLTSCVKEMENLGRRENIKALFKSCVGSPFDFTKKHLPGCESLIFTSDFNNFSSPIWQLDPSVRKKTKCKEKYKKLRPLAEKKCEIKVAKDITETIEKKAESCKKLISPVIVNICNTLGFDVLHKEKK